MSVGVLPNETAQYGQNTTDASITLACGGMKCICDFMEAIFTAIGLPLGTAEQADLDIIRDQIEWKQNLGLSIVPSGLVDSLPELAQSWLANIMLAVGLYLGVGAIWCAWIYGAFKNTRYGVPEATIPSKEAILEQVSVSLAAIPLYCLMPVMTEQLVLRGWTLAYARVESFGLAAYAMYFVAYMSSVEFGVYWMHRKLHEVRWAYKYLHATHHVYNKEHTLSPMAGLAFNPIDGMLQAVPYVWTMLLVPMHFFTHEVLLFATALWTTSIHDCIYGGGEPIMGAGYHTIHHTTYRHNYGHYTIFMDKWFGTLKVPAEHKASRAKAQ